MATSSCAKAGETVESPNGVTIIAPDNLPATMPAGASAFYARNISALLLGMVKDGALNLDFEDEVTGRRSSPRAARSVRRPSRSCSSRPHRPPEAPREPRTDSLRWPSSTLAILVGFEVISKVPATLHTPLMSGANSIHGIVLVGAMIIAAEADNPASYVLAFVAMVVRGDERRGWLRRHRPNAPDVPQEADGPQGPRGADALPAPDRGAAMSQQWIYTIVFLAWLAGASCFVSASTG